MNTLTTAVTGLVNEYELLDGSLAASAGRRRAIAMERTTAALFVRIDAELDPYHEDELNEDVAEANLDYSNFVSDLLTTAMLDFREKAVQHGHHPETYRDRLTSMLLDICEMSIKELMDRAD